jgi:RND family efflux transporter MFP subunit
MIKFLKKRWYLVLIIIVVGVLLFIRNQNSANSAEKKQETYKVKRENLKETLTLSGEIDADEKASLKFQTSGRLSWVGVKEGDQVKKYQVIASLDQRDLKNRMQKYLNTYSSDRLAFEQTKDDYWNKQFDLSQSVRESAERTLKDSQYDLNNSVLDVELQSLSLEYANLWSPIDGIVTHIDTPFSGINVTPAGSEFQVVNPNTIYLSVTAEQSDVVLLKKGMAGEIVFDAYPENTYMGEVDYISFAPKSGESGTVYQVKLLLDGAAHRLPLKMAMTGDVSFVMSERKNVIGVPAKFINTDNKGSYVNVERNGKKEKIYIKKGEEIDGIIMIKSGLEVEDIIYD